MANLTTEIENPKSFKVPASEVILHDFQVENFISQVEHSLSKLKENPDVVSAVVARWIESDLQHFKNAITKSAIRKGVAHV